MFLHCSRCDAPVNIATSTGAPPWCPFCGVKFEPASNKARKPRPADPDPATLPSVLPILSARRPLPPETGLRASPPPPRDPALRASPPPPPPADQPCPRVPLPEGMPAEVVTLGDPEEVYAPDDRQVEFNRNLLYLAAGFTTILLFGLAAFLFFAFFNKSFGVNRPPDAVFLVLGSGAALLGLLLFGLALWSSTSAHALNRWGPRTYLVYQDVLAEVFPDRHRLIPWEKLGTPQTNTVLGVTYRFPVEGEKGLTFDNTVSDHAELAQLIQEKAAERRFLECFGDETELDALRRVRVGPSVMTHKMGFVTQAYRITVLGDRLLFYKVAATAGLSPTPPPNMGGLVGAMAVWSHSKARQKFLLEMEEVEAANADTLLRLAGRNDGSFLVSAEDVREVQLDPPSVVKSFLFGVNGLRHRGVVKLVHATRGAMSLALLSREDVATVMEAWPNLFGEKLTLNLAWDPTSASFVARK